MGITAWSNLSTREVLGREGEGLKSDGFISFLPSKLWYYYEKHELEVSALLNTVALEVGARNFTTSSSCSKKTGHCRVKYCITNEVRLSLQSWFLYAQATHHTQHSTPSNLFWCSRLHEEETIPSVQRSSILILVQWKKCLAPSDQD